MNHLFSKKHNYIFLLVLVLIATPSISKFNDKTKFSFEIKKSDLYTQLNLSAFGLKQSVFDIAIAGWNRLNNKQQLQKSGLLSIVDMSQSSNCKRLYILDIEKKDAFV